MGFGRHRERVQSPPVTKKIVTEEKKETTKVLVEEQPIVEKEPEVKQELPVNDKEEISNNDIEDVPSLSQDRPQEFPEKSQDPTNEIEVNNAADEVIQQIEKEEISRLPVKDKKKREDKKSPNLIGVVGKTIVANEFRAIVKKKGEQINDVLSDILHKWNTENYNL